MNINNWEYFSEIPKMPEPLQNEAFLMELLETSGPSGFEELVADICVDNIWEISHHVERTKNNNIFAVKPRLPSPADGMTFVSTDSPTVFLAHMDEIGIIITHIDDNGFCFFDEIGGWDPAILVGQRVTFDGDNFPNGVIVRKPTHLMKDDEQEKIKIKDLWIDIGTNSREETEKYFQVGSVGVLDVSPIHLSPNILVSRALDNRVGVFSIFEALKQTTGNVVAVGTTREEIGGAGALNAVNAIANLSSIIVVDVTHALDYPGADEDHGQHGNRKLGSGPAIGVGGVVDKAVSDKLKSIANSENIPYTLEAVAGKSGTDADMAALARIGHPIGIVSIPIRYMHTPNEMVNLDDVRNTIKLLTKYAEAV